MDRLKSYFLIQRVLNSAIISALLILNSCSKEKSIVPVELPSPTPLTDSFPDPTATLLPTPILSPTMPVFSFHGTADLFMNEDLEAICSDESSTHRITFRQRIFTNTSDQENPEYHGGQTYTSVEEIQVDINSEPISDEILYSIFSPSEADEIFNLYNSSEEFHLKVVQPFVLKHELYHACTSVREEITKKHLANLFNENSIMEGDNYYAQGFIIFITDGSNTYVNRGLEEFFTVYLNYMHLKNHQSDPFLTNIYYKLSRYSLNSLVSADFFDLLVLAGQTDINFVDNISQAKNESDLPRLFKLVPQTITNFDLLSNSNQEFTKDGIEFLILNILGQIANTENY